MIIDTSAIIAVLLAENDAARILEAIKTQAPVHNRIISAATLLESSIVIYGRKRETGVQEMNLLLRETGISAQPFDAQQVAFAFDAHKRYGKGNGHKANLNFGDCFSYALTKQRNDTLLCKGDDFAHTDIKLATY